MRIVHLDTYHVAIPLRFAFTHRLAARAATDSLVVRLEDGAGRTGFGESAPRRYVTGETVAGADARVRDVHFPRLAKRSFGDFDEVVNWLRAAANDLPRDGHAAFCALELALLDLAGKAFGHPAAAPLGPPAARSIEYGGVVPAGDPGLVESLCQRLRDAGFRAVKVKVGRTLDEDVAALATARRILGDDCSLRVDANAAWTAPEALSRIDAFAPFRIDAVEQPAAAGDLDGMARITAASPVPIIADESLVSVADARLLAGRRCCHAFNLRISKCGGLLNTARIRAVALRAGLRCMLGAHVGETAILSAAGRQAAARWPDLWFREGSYGTLLLERDLAAEDVTLGRGGTAPLLEGDGLGIDVAEDRLPAPAAARVDAASEVASDACAPAAGDEEDPSCSS